MPEFSSRPDGYPIHASSGNPGSNIRPSRNSLFRTTGYTVNSIIQSDDHNGKFQSIGFWIGYSDMGTVRNSDWLDSTVIRQLSADTLSYTVGTNPTVFPGSEPLTRTSLIFNGTRVETDTETLQTAIANTTVMGEPLYLPNAVKPGRIWVYLRVPADPTATKGVRIVGGAAGLADTPEAEEQALVGVDIDGAGLITGHTAPTTQPLVRQLPVATPVFFDSATVQDLTVVDTLGVGGLSTLDALDVTNDLDVAGATTLKGLDATSAIIQNVATLKIGLNVIGASDETAVQIDGGADTAITAVSSGAEDTTIIVNQGTGRAAFYQNDDALNCTLAVDQLGDACAMQVGSAGSSPTIELENTGTGIALQVTSAGTDATLDVENTSTGPAGSLVNDDLLSPTLLLRNVNAGGLALTTDGGATLGTGSTQTVQILATAVVPSLGATTLKGSFNVLSAISGFVGEITSDATAVLLWSGSATFNGRLNVNGTSSTTAGDLSKVNGELQYQNSGGTGIVYHSPSGLVNGFGESLAPIPAANILVDTSAAVAPFVAADLKITGTAWVQRDIAGDCTISIEEVGGIGQLGTADAISVPKSGTTDYQVITFTRIRAAADTTPRIYRLKITGGGSNVVMINGTVTVSPAP